MLAPFGARRAQADQLPVVVEHRRGLRCARCPGAVRVDRGVHPVVDHRHRRRCADPSATRHRRVAGVGGERHDDEAPVGVDHLHADDRSPTAAWRSSSPCAQEVQAACVVMARPSAPIGVTSGKAGAIGRAPLDGGLGGGAFGGGAFGGGGGIDDRGRNRARRAVGEGVGRGGDAVDGAYRWCVRRHPHRDRRDGGGRRAPPSPAGARRSWPVRWCRRGGGARCAGGRRRGVGGRDGRRRAVGTLAAGPEGGDHRRPRLAARHTQRQQDGGGRQHRGPDRRRGALATSPVTTDGARSASVVVATASPAWSARSGVIVRARTADEQQADRAVVTISSRPPRVAGRAAAPAAPTGGATIARAGAAVRSVTGSQSVADAHAQP